MDNEIGRSQCAIDTNGHCYTSDAMMLTIVAIIAGLFLIAYFWGDETADNISVWLIGLLYLGTPVLALVVLALRAAGLVT